MTDGLIHVAANTDWRGWLARHYPDQAKRWPGDAAKAFKPLKAGGTWDFIGTGDYERDGNPAAVLFRFLPPKEPGAGAMSAFLVAKWLDGRWVRLIDLRAGKGARINGKPSSDFACEDGYLVDLAAGDDRGAARTGMSFFLELANRHGEGMSDPAQLFYRPKEKKYFILDGDGAGEARDE